MVRNFLNLIVALLLLIVSNDQAAYAMGGGAGGGASANPMNIYSQPRTPREARRMICENEVESSSESYIEQYLGGQTIIESWAGNEEQCLRDAGVLVGDSINPRFSARRTDVDRFFNQCAYETARGPASVMELVQQAGDAVGFYHLQNRDALLNLSLIHI